MYKKLIYPLVLLLVLFSATVVQGQTPEELIIDGGFEAGIVEEAPPNPWAVEVTDTNTVTIVGSQSPFGPSGHQQSAQIVKNVAGDAILKQLVSFDGSDYLLMSCDIMLVTGAETFSIRLGDILGETNGISLTLSTTGGLKALEGIGTERVIFAASNVTAGKWYRLQAIIPGISVGTYRVTLEEYEGARLVSDSINVTTAIPSPGSTGSATVDNVSLVTLDPTKVPVIESKTPVSDAVLTAAPTSVTVTFDEDVVAKALEGITIMDAGGNSPSGVTAGLEADNKTVKITWTGGLTDGIYTVIIPQGAFENLVGNGNAQIVWSFTVDTTAPTITSVTIEPQVVVRGKNITIKVAAQDATGVSGGSAAIFAPGGEIATATVALTLTEGLLSGVWIVPGDSGAGTWKVGSITLTDTLENSNVYTRNDTFEVVESASSAIIAQRVPVKEGDAEVYSDKISLVSETKTFHIIVDGVAGDKLNTIGGKLIFDSTKIRIDAMTSGFEGTVHEGTFFYNVDEKNPGTVIFGGGRTEKTDGITGAIITVTATALDTSSDSSNIGLEITQAIAAGAEDGIPFIFDTVKGAVIENYLLGDADHNGVVRPSDAVETLRFALGISVLGDPFDPVVADVDNNFQITTSDAMNVLRMSLGLELN